MIATNRPDESTRARGREFWRQELLDGACTVLPRWTREPVAGVDDHEVRIPKEVVAGLDMLVDELGISLGTVLLAAHAKVLGTLSGDHEVTTGYVARSGGPPLPCRVSTEPHTWLALLLESQRARLELIANADFPLEDLRRELDVTRPLFETVLDPMAADDGELADGTVLRLSLLERNGLVLRLRWRTDALDGECAVRLAGYHLTALERMAADPDAEHARQSLVSGEERQFQIEGLAGPRVELPDRRVHELFEERARMHADAIAAVHRGRTWSYRQLNARANRVARALLARGLRPEGVVAVVTERNLEWLASVLGIFKAGGAYLPIEPHFPADRIVKMLSRSDCRLVLTERESMSTLDRALDSLAQVRALHVHAVLEEGHGDGDVGHRVGPDQLAYLYFTSGSTGEPKGAMCQHAGMLNHLLAKIHDLGIGEGDVVAQVAPQCFDISLWQLVSALLVGGRTLLVEQDAILDAERFLDRIVGCKVAVLQVVPSYLEVLLSCLELRPRPLPDLRCVSVTGEALRKELVQRWFAAQPAIRLVNAYGLTETSDDTNHEVMERVPDHERVPLGRPIQNVHVYVVDEQLSPVPLGAPGEIAFSGVCVGRGYVNDAERTSRAFLPDPHRQGQRLYRSGDHGRWLPDGKLEFLGRRDHQVKISGFRIEIGEVESALARVPGVRDGAVVVAGRIEQGRRLVAFYSGEQPLEHELLRDRLGTSLPAYMVPASFHWRQSMPLTANGKLDRKALTEIVGQLDGRPDVAERGHERPRTASEQRLAAIWADLLGIPSHRIGVRDHFFDLGGTSLTAVKLVVALRRAVTLRDLIEHPTLADLAGLLDRQVGRHSETGRN